MRTFKIFILILGLLNSASVLAENLKGVYRCSLLIQDVSGKSLLDIRNKSVTTHLKRGEGETTKLTELFEGLGPVIREATVSNSEILMNTSWVRLGGELIPEMSLGVYHFNKLATDRRSVMVEGRGDARSIVKITGHTSNGSRIQVACRNESLIEI